MSDERKWIFEGIEAERERQDRKWGGKVHDDAHSRRDWVAFIVRQLGHAEARSNNVGMGDYNYAMVKVAALAIAAIESTHRRFNL